MSTLTVWKFPEADGAQEALATLGQLQSERLITVLDGAVVTWPEGAKKPKTRQLSETPGRGASAARSGGCCSG
jgi:uncharacterized membrane protein